MYAMASRAFTIKHARIVSRRIGFYSPAPQRNAVPIHHEKCIRRRALLADRFEK